MSQDKIQSNFQDWYLKIDKFNLSSQAIFIIKQQKVYSIKKSQIAQKCN